MESRIKSVEDSIERHETVIEMLRNQLVAIHQGVARIEATLHDRAPAGESQFCRSHMASITALHDEVTDLRREVDAVKAWIWKGLGAIAVLVFIIPIVSPWLRAVMIP